jgi:hypothetical protein
MERAAKRSRSSGSCRRLCSSTSETR